MDSVTILQGSCSIYPFTDKELEVGGAENER